MPAVDYIWQKAGEALVCLSAGDGPFEERAYDAYTSSLYLLEPADATSDLADDLGWVLRVCAEHLVPGEERMLPFSDVERNGMADKLLGLLVEATRAEG